MLLILGLSILIFHGVTLFLGVTTYLINLHVAVAVEGENVEVETQTEEADDTIIRKQLE